MDGIDLHTHSTASDGTYSPKELVDYAFSKGLSAIALTDHDTTDGIKEALAEAERIRSEGGNFELIPGIELSSGYMGKEIHIIGLFMDPDNEFLKRRLEKFIINREKRNRQMCSLCTEKGLPISYEEMREEFGDTVLTRAHFAKIMMKKGYVKSVKEAFERYVGDGKPCFVSRKKITPMRAVEIIRRSGGFPIFAHPLLTGMSKENLDRLTAKLKGAGLMGIEAFYGTYTPADEREVMALAKKYDLVLSGGSDFHGQNKTHIDIGKGTGRLYIHQDWLAKIKSGYDLMLSDNDSYRLPKILFTDLDGTLLDSKKNISEYTFDTIKRWTEAGHYVALCSGRDVNSVLEVYRHLGFDSLNNMFVIGYNGGQIYDCTKQKTIYKNTLDKEALRHIISVAEKSGVYLHTYSEKNIIAPRQTKELEFYTRVIKTPVIFSEDILAPLDEGPCKCIAIELDDRSKLERFIEELSSYNKEHNISMMFSSQYYLEVIPGDSGKGRSVDVLCKLLNNPDLLVVSAGDEENDISMLDAADVAIAMENGRDEIKNHATNISDGDNDHDGLARSLQDLI
ncbi:MAG: Cof-type HAD-IIB family hydrolase [Lachnospiraceae bacterium]|nr:Cof-type HAD-IIB family hydrolase [Lachnospiraceae bacterium]